MAYGKAKTSTDFYICIVSVLVINCIEKSRIVQSFFLVTANNIKASKSSFELPFTTSYIIWLRIRIINKDAVWQFKIWIANGTKKHVLLSLVSGLILILGIYWSLENSTFHNFYCSLVIAGSICVISFIFNNVR